MSEHDYEELGLKVGLEIHQQLDTEKLFCRCPSMMVEGSDDEILRYLRPTASEMGEIDRAALMEAQKGMRFRYQRPKEATCLVEMDEEPPEGPDEEAIELVLKLALMTGSSIVDEVHFMRKIVIDGSNTTGFQRTALVATDGEITLDGKDIGISTICLEEDAARKVEAKGKEKVYRLDRLGIPLIELATDPDIRSPEQAKEVAQYIGGLLRATRKVKRGIGTIREDVNISIAQGARVEIKGVQDLKMLPSYVEMEVERQLALLGIKEILDKRGSEVSKDIHNLSDIFEGCNSKLVASSLEQGKGVYGIKLIGFQGTLRGEEGEALLGPELSAYAKTAGVGGIFHSDELPAYGISAEECDAVKAEMEVDELDSFVLVVDKEEKAVGALENVMERAEMAFDGVPEETRNALEDGSTVFLRPLSGGARMYPETDIPPYIVSKDMLDDMELPETLGEKVERFHEEYGLNKQQSTQLFRKGYDILFEDLVEEGVDPSVATNTFLHTFNELSREGYDTDKLSDEQLEDVLMRVENGEFAKEGIPKVLTLAIEGKSIEDALEELGLGSVDEDEVRRAIKDIIEERKDFVEQRGMGAMGPLMGVVMKEFRGKVDGKEISRILREEIQNRCG